MPTKTKVAHRRREHPVTKQELRENNPSIADAVTQRLGPVYRLAVAVTAIGAVAWGGFQVYDWSGARKLVSDVTLSHAISEVKNEVNIKIDSTKNDVLHNQNTMKDQINGNLGKLNETLGAISHSQTTAAMDQADMQMRLAFTQKQSLQGQLSVVTQALAKDPNDQLALSRKMQLEDFIKQNDQYMQDAQIKMTRLRNN